MKSYSGKGIFDSREARSRRKQFDSKNWRGLCRGAVALSNGNHQLDDTEAGCRALAVAESTFEYTWFDGSLEEWLDGKPCVTKIVD